MYEALAEHYEQLFPPSDALVALAERLSRERPILDVGCAGGALVRRLGERAFGLEREGAMARLSPRTAVGDMTSLPFARRFGLALLTGNTLANAASGAPRERVLAELARVLLPVVAAVVFTVNFARIA